MGRLKLPLFILSTVMAVALPQVGKGQIRWDPDGNPTLGTYGGSGTWDTTSLFWDDDGAAPNVPWINSLPIGNHARFEGTAGTITLGVPIVARFLDFNVPGYQLTNGGNAANTLTFAGPLAGILLQSGTMTVGLQILGDSGLRFDDSTPDTDGLKGTLILSNTANTYSGVTTIVAGVLETSNLTNVGQASSIGVGGDAFDAFGFPNITPYISLDGGTLRYTGTGVATNRTFTITNRGGGIDSSGTGASLGFSTTSAGIQSIGTGPRTFTLTGTNIALNNLAAPIGDSSDANSATSVVKSGTGTWMVTAANVYTGSTTLAGGNLVVSTIGNGGAPSSLGQGVNDPQNLVFNGGTLRYIGAATSTDRAFTVGPAGGKIDSVGAGAMTFSNSASSVSSGSGNRTLTLGGTTNGNLMRVQLADPTTVWALNGSNGLVRINPATPETFDQQLTLSGLTGGESLHSIDFRPTTGELFAMGTTATGATNRIYKINLTTGAATLVGTVGSLTLSGGNPGAANGYYGFDFNPTNDTIRVVGADLQNLRINSPLFTTFTGDTALTAGSRITGLAYSNNVSGATSTALYGINALGDTLVTINPEDGGVVSSVGLLSGGAFAVNVHDTISDVGFDIASNGAAYASIRGSDNVYRLYNIDLLSGAASLLGASGNPRIGTGAAPIRDISVAIDGALSLLKTGPGTWTLDRSGSSSGHTYSGATTINQGTLTLNFNQTTTPNTHLISPSSPLVIGGGTLAITGKAGAALPTAPPAPVNFGTLTNKQSFNGFTLLPGSSVITANLATNNIIDLTIGTLSSRPAYATVAFPAPPPPRILFDNNPDPLIVENVFDPSTVIVRLNATNDATGILGAWATIGGTDWAVVNAGTVEAFTGYADVALGDAIANAPTSHVRINSGTSGNITLAAATTTINTLDQNLTTAATVGTTGGTLRLGAVGGILVGAGRSSLTIGTTAANVGTLTAGSADNTAGELILLNNSSNNLTINSVIANNGTGATTLVNSGTGVTVLAGVNTYTGGTILNSGTLRIADNRSLSTGTITVNGGTTLPTLASSSGIGREIANDLVLNSDLQFVDATGTGGIVLRGVVNLTGGQRILSVTQANGYVTLDGTITNGSLIKSGPGALALLDIALTNISDITIAQGSLDVWSPTGLGTTTIFAANGALSASGAFYAPVMSTISAGGNLTLGRVQVSDGIDLGGLIDLSNSTVFSPRIITAAGAQPQQQQRISGTIVSGALAKAGASELYITGSTSTYEGSTLVFSTATGSSLRVSPAGRLGGNAIGNDIYVVQDPFVTPTPAIIANSFAILRLESLANVQSNQSVYLNNYTAIATPFLGWGAAFDASQTSIGFVDPFNVFLSDTGLANIRVNNAAGFPVGIAIDGIRSNADTVGKVLAGVPNVHVWLGATLLNATYTGQGISLAADATYRLGGGGGTLTIAGANVLTDANNVITGSFDQIARGITGTVYLPNPQNFSGTLTVGAGTTLVTGINSALGSGTAPIILAGGVLNLRSTGTHYSTDSQYAARNFSFIGSSTINLDPLGGGQNGRVEIGALDFSTVANALPTPANPTFTSNNTNNFELRVTGAVTLISNLPQTPNTSATNFFTVNSGFLTIETPIGQTDNPGGTGVANFTKQGGATLILTQPSTFTGSTTVNGGTLVLADPDAVQGLMRLQSGVLSLRSNSLTSVDFNFSDFDLGGGGTIFVGPISPLGTASYSGTTIRVPKIDAGTQTALTVNGTLNSSLQVIGQMTLGANFTLTVNAARTELLGGIGGNFNFTKAGIGTLTVSGANLSTGDTTITQGTIIANHDAGSVVDTFGDGTLSFSGTLSGGILLAGTRTLAKDIALNTNGGTHVLGGFDAGAKTFSGNVTIPTDGTPTGSPNDVGVTLTAESGSTVSFTGTISGGVGGSVAIGSLSGNVLIPIAGTPALGRGTILLNPAAGTGNSFTLPLVVNNGTLIGQAQATSGSPFGNSSNAITLNQATLQLNGRAASTITTNGALAVVGGAQLVINDPSDAFTTRLSVASLARAGVGTLTYIPLGNTGQEIVNIASAPALVNGILPPWIVRSTSGADRTGNFLTLSSGNLTTATYTSGNIDSATSSQVFNVTTGGPLTLDRSVYALKSAINLNLGAKTLRVGDAFATGAGVANAAGGIILNGGAGIASGTLDFGQAEGVIYVDGAATSTISAAITGTAGIVGVTPTDTRTAGTVTNGSAVISGLPSTARLAPGSLVTGTGVPANTFISAILSPTSVQLSANATADNSNVVLTFTGDTSLSKVGNGTLVLSGANTYRGGTVINEGTLRMGAANALGRYTNNGLVVPSAVTLGSRGVLELNGFATEIGALAGAFGSVVDLGSARLTVGRSSNALNIPTTFSGRLLGTAGSVLQKLGPGTLTLDNTRADGNASTFAGSILVDQGTLAIVVADRTNGSPFAVGNSLASSLTLTLRGGTVSLQSSGDNTATNQNLVGGYNVVVTGANSTLTATRFSSTETNKTIELGNLTLGRNDFIANTANSVSLTFAGVTTLTDNARINSNELTLAGKVTDNGAGFTLNKVGGNLFLANSLNDYSGGTVITGGNLFFGSRGPDQVRFPGFGFFVPNDTARAGTGPIVVNTNSVINFTDRENLGVGQTVRVLNSTLAHGNNSGFVIQTDRAVSEFNLRATGRGSLQIGVQNGTYYTPLDMSKIGNGEWGLTSGRSVETLYMPSTLGAGAGNVHRFYGSSGAAFVLMEPNVITGATPVELGRQLQDAGTLPGNANASIRFMLGQNYTGSTIIHRTAAAAGPSNALLDFRGTLASGTSAANPIEVYGRLVAVGAGTFTNSAGGQVNTNIALRPGGELALDYNNNASNNTAFLVPLGATSATGFLNKWADTQAITLDGASLRVASAAGSLTTEIIGSVTYKGAAEIFPQSVGTGGNSVVIINGTLSRVNLGTFALRSTSGQLGVSGEPGTNAGQRVVFNTLANATASGVVRGVVASGPATGTVVSMVPARFYSNTANTFLDYAPTTVLGFSDVPFITRLNATVFNSGGLNNGTEIVNHITDTTPDTNATTVNAGADVWALRTNIDIGSSSTVNSITIRSGGLAVTDAGTIFAPLIFRNGTLPANNVEADIWTVSGTVTLRGTVEANSLVKTGAGTLVLAGNNTSTLTGSIQINGGTLVLGGVNAAGVDVTAAQALGSVTSLRLHAGNFNNAGNQMPQVNLLSNTAATYSQSIIVSEFIPFATLNVDRVSGTGTNQGLTVSGGLTIEGGGSDGTVLAFTNGADFDFTSSGVTTLGLAGNTARIGISVTNTNGTNNVTFSGRVTGPAPVVKSGNGPLILRYTNAANPQNDFTGGITLNAGTLQLRNDTATTALTLAGTGSTAGIDINAGTLLLISDTTNTNFASNSGNHLTIRGQMVLQIDRVGANTPSLILGGDTATFTTRNSPTIQIQTASGTVAGGVWAGRTVIHDSPTFNTASTSLQLGNATGSDSITGSGHIYKTGNNVLIFNSAGANTFSGGLDIFQGQVRVATTTDTLGTGAIRISPAGVLGVTAAANVSSNTQVANFHSNSTALAGLAIRTNGLAATSFLNAANITSAAGNGGLLAIDTTVTSANPVNLSTLFDGNWFLGSTAVGIYQAALTAGANSTYRLGGGGNTLTLNTTANMLTGANKALIGKPHALAGNGAVVINIGNNYSGGTTISRVRDIGGGFTVSQANAQVGATISAFGTGAVEVFGNLVIESTNGAAASISPGSNRNTYAFHPGARLLFSNTTAYGGTTGASGRWDDAVGVALRSSGLEQAGNATSPNNQYNSETVGAVTFSGGSEIRVARGGTTVDAQLVMASLARVGTGTLTVLHTGSSLGLNAYSGTDAAGTGSDVVTVTGGVPMTNNMVAPYMVSRADNQFLKYDPTNGLQIVTQLAAPANYIASTATTLTAPSNNGTEIFSYDTTTSGASATLGANLNVHALRLLNNVNPSANGQFNTVTIGSGGLLMFNNNDTTTISLNANVVFGSVASPGEALIAFNAVGTNRFAQLNGVITASGVTKFGTGLFSIAQDQPAFSGTWNVNQGTLQILTPGGMGTGPVNLNGWTGNTGQTQTELRFVFNPGTPDELTFTSGKITATDMNLIRSTMGSVNDRTARIAAIDLKTTNAVAGTGMPGLIRFQVDNLRNLLRTGAMTMFDDYVVQVDATSFGPGSTTGVRPDSINNAGAYNLTKIGDGVLVLGDNSTTFTGSGKTFTVNEGAVTALSNGSLGAAATTAIIDNGGALEIATPGFSPVGTLTQRAGSIERWAVNGARSGTVNLPAGVHLQIAANQTGTQTINLNGGSIMGYLPVDVDEIAVFHRLGANVSVNLQADSMIGQPYPAGTNTTSGSANHIAYDMGKQNQPNNPLNPVLNGSVLEIRGNISAASTRTLTKVGLDLVQLSGTNTGFNTTIREGTLVLGSASALPSNMTLTMASDGALDLNGFNASTATLAGSSPQSLIVNSATTTNSLTVNGGSSYAGGLSGNLGFIKSGAADFTLSGTLAHSGPTTAMAGKLILTGSATGTTTFKANSGATLDVSGVAGGFKLLPAQTLLGGVGATTGTVLGSVTAQAGSIISPGFELGLTGKLQIDSGNLTLESNSTFKLELAGAIAGSGYDQLVVSNGSVNLGGATLDGTVAFGSVMAGEVYYIVLHNTGANSGAFAGLPQLSFFSIGGYEFQINYAADFGGAGFASASGNDVALLVTVPEPGSFAGLCAGLGTLLGLRRFRRGSRAL